jgi:hypothetical protein
MSDIGGSTSARNKFLCAVANGRHQGQAETRKSGTITSPIASGRTGRARCTRMPAQVRPRTGVYAKSSAAQDEPTAAATDGPNPPTRPDPRADALSPRRRRRAVQRSHAPDAAIVRSGGWNIAAGPSPRDPCAIFHPQFSILAFPWPSRSRIARVAFPRRAPKIPRHMIHDNLPAAIEDLSSRIIAIRDSL